MRQFLILFLSALFYLWANNAFSQGTVSVAQGSARTFLVYGEAGYSYDWHLILPDGSSSVLDSKSSESDEVTFEEEGNYLLRVQATNSYGCLSEWYTITVQVSPLNLFVQFMATESQLCFGDLSSAVELPLSFYDQEDGALAESRYPISLNYTINGVAQTPQTISNADQSLSITRSQLTGDGSSDQLYTIAITGATDAQNTTIQAQSGYNTYQLTILAQPQFSFSKAAVALTKGDVRSFAVNSTQEFIYNWRLIHPDGTTETLPSKSEDTGDITFSQPGTYQLEVQAVAANNCSSEWQTVTIEVTSVDLFIAFITNESTTCYDNTTYQLPVTFSDQFGAALEESAFPISIRYTVDGVAQTPQTISYGSQQLAIANTQLSGSGLTDKAYTIEITGGTDSSDNPLQTSTGKDIYSFTLLAQPKISFAQTSLELDAETVRAFTVNGSSEFIYDWVLVYPDGTEQALQSKAETTEDISFLLTGVYTLKVQALASNGCFSAWQSVSVTVSSGGDDGGDPEPVPGTYPTLAVCDVNIGWMGQTITGNVLTNDIHDIGEINLTVTAQPDASTGRLTQFDKKTGAYTFVPSNGFTGEASFEYSLCETLEDGTVRCSESQVTVELVNTDLKAALPVAADKYFALGKNGSMASNFVNGDFSLTGEDLSVSSVNSSALSGSFSQTSNGGYSYSPQTDFEGRESFNYKLCGSSLCDWSTVTLYTWGEEFVNCDLLAANALFYNEGVLTATLPANAKVDAGVDYGYYLVDGPQNGTVTLNEDGSFVYTPSSGQTGYFSDQFVYKISNPAGAAEATVYINSYVEAPQLIVQNQFTTGACVNVNLDASKSSGVEPLSYSWTPNNYLSDASSANPIFTPGESTSYTLTLTDALGNTDSRNVAVVVDPTPDVVTSNLVFVNNASESILLDASESIGNGLTYNWVSSGSGVIVSGQNTATPEVKGTGKYYLTITDQHGCMDRDSVVVGIWIQAVDDQAEALVNNYVAINVLRNDIPQGNIDPSSVSIVVPPSNGIAEVQADSTIIYTPDQDYIGEDEFIYQVCDYRKQCDEATVLVMVSEEAIFIPNAFTPNGDGYNDRFEIKGLAKYDRVQIRIFNRWGNLVYESDDYANSGFWDGIATKGVRVGKGQVPSGVYFYTLNLGKGEKQLSGYIYIDR